MDSLKNELSFFIYVCMCAVYMTIYVLNAQHKNLARSLITASFFSHEHDFGQRRKNVPR